MSICFWVSPLKALFRQLATHRGVHNQKPTWFLFVLVSKHQRAPFTLFAMPHKKSQLNCLEWELAGLNAFVCSCRKPGMISTLPEHNEVLPTEKNDPVSGLAFCLFRIGGV